MRLTLEDSDEPASSAAEESQAAAKQAGTAAKAPEPPKPAPEPASQAPEPATKTTPIQTPTFVEVLSHPALQFLLKLKFADFLSYFDNASST